MMVNFLMVEGNIIEADRLSYLENVVEELKNSGYISEVIPAYGKLGFGQKSDVFEINDGVYSTNFIFFKDKKCTNWEISFEFETFEVCNQLQVKITSGNYKITVEDNYLESLKLKIKNIMKPDWKNIIWLADKDSELLSIKLYAHIYRVESLTRQFINEIMNKLYGIGWWDMYVPLEIQNKHKVRIRGYKSITTGFQNVDERLMSIDLGDLSSIITLKEKRWIPTFNLDVNKFLNQRSRMDIEQIKKILSENMEDRFNLWEDHFSNYLSNDFIDKFKDFELNRNHIAHNKLIDRAAYSTILSSVILVENDLSSAINQVEKIFISKEQRNIIEQKAKQEKLELEKHVKNIMESETGVNIRSVEEIIDLYNESLYQIYSDIKEYLRFRNDLEITEYTNIEYENYKGELFEIVYKITGDKAIISYVVKTLEDSQGEDTCIDISIYTDDNHFSKSIGYINGEVEFDSQQGCYLPCTKDEISTIDLDALMEGIIGFIDTYFENIREKIDSDIYYIIKDGGISPVAEEPCCECGEAYICVNKEYGDFGQCLNCGEINSICLCERCNTYFEGDESEYSDVPNLCGNCQSYYK